MSNTDSTDNGSAFNGLRISDLSRLTGIPVSTLRFWCDQNLLVPTNRSSVDSVDSRLLLSGHVFPRI